MSRRKTMAIWTAREPLCKCAESRMVSWLSINASAMATRSRPGRGFHAPARLVLPSMPARWLPFRDLCPNYTDIRLPRPRHKSTEWRKTPMNELLKEWRDNWKPKDILLPARWLIRYGVRLSKWKDDLTVLLAIRSSKKRMPEIRRRVLYQGDRRSLN